VIAHVAEQQMFVQKLSDLLHPGGHLMLAAQNDFVLRYLNRIAPPAAGQLRRWTSRRELRQLLAPEFEIQELFSVTPQSGRGLGLGGWSRSRNIGGLIRAFSGRQAETSKTDPDTSFRVAPRRRRLPVRLFEAMGLGWTLMAWGQKRRPVREGRF